MLPKIPIPINYQQQLKNVAGKITGTIGGAGEALKNYSQAALSRNKIHDMRQAAWQRASQKKTISRLKKLKSKIIK